MSFVLDASVALLWLAPDTNAAGVNQAIETLNALRQSQAHVPSLFTLELANVVAKLEAKGMVKEADSQRFIELVTRLDIVTDQVTAEHALGNILNLARRYKLSAYDGAYLELAQRMGLPIATLDANLAKAANIAGVRLFGVA